MEEKEDISGGRARFKPCFGNNRSDCLCPFLSSLFRWSYGPFRILPPGKFSDLIITVLSPFSSPFSICEVDLGQRPLHRSRGEVLGGAKNGVNRFE